VCAQQSIMYDTCTRVLHSNFCELKFEICTITKLSKSVLRWSQARSLSSHELNDVCIPHTFSRFLSGISLHCHILLSNAYCAAQHGFTTCNSLPSYTTDCYVHPKAMALPSLRVWISESVWYTRCRYDGLLLSLTFCLSLDAFLLHKYNWREGRSGRVHTALHQE